MIKKLVCILVLMFSASLMAAVPTEEGLLKNASNEKIDQPYIAVTFAISKLGEDKPQEFYKYIYRVATVNDISLTVFKYSNALMQDAQLLSSVTYPNVLTEIKRNSKNDAGLFNAIMLMLATNQPGGVEAFLAKHGVGIVDNSRMINADKMALLTKYKDFLQKNPGRSDAGSPLNPEDAKQRDKAVELFRENTYKRAPNVELTRRENQFYWRADWKNTQMFFSNETREFRIAEFTEGDQVFKIQAQNYVSLNRKNTIPKMMNIKDSQNQYSKVEILGQDTLKDATRFLAKASQVRGESLKSNFGFMF